MESEWELLEPLLREGFVDLPSAWRCLLQHQTALEQGVSLARRRWRSSLSPSAVAELYQDVCCSLMEKVRRHQGLWVPSPRQSAAAWLRMVVRNQAIDVLRQQSRHQRGYALEEHHRSIESAVGTLEDAQVAVLDQQRQQQQLPAGLAQVLPLHALAWVLLHQPDHLQPSHVQAALAVSEAGDEGAGLCRDLAALWPLLETWREVHHLDPSSQASRRRLAWILRSNDSTDPDRWRAADPDACCRARDLLRQWARRASKVLENK